MNILKKMMKNLGNGRRSEKRLFEVEGELYNELVDLAEREGKPVRILQAEVMRDGLNRRKEAQTLWETWRSLSRRQQQVTALTCLGYSNREIAEKLKITTGTVKTHVEAALAKFHLSHKGDLNILLRGWDFEAWL